MSTMKKSRVVRKRRTNRTATTQQKTGVVAREVLMLAPDEQDEERELEFELDHQLSLTTAQRFEMMFRKSREIAEELTRHGYRKPAEIIKRS